MKNVRNELPEVSVVLTTYNRRVRLERSLDALRAAQDRGVTAEIVCVDNNSQDGTRALVQARVAAGAPGLVYVFEPRQGVAYARNTGVLHARADIVAFTDDDEDVASDWLQVIATTLRAHPEWGFIAGKVLPRWPSPPPPWLDLPHWGTVGLVNPGDIPLDLDAQNPRNVRAVGGGNLAVRRALIARHAFDPRFQRVRETVGTSEDWDLLNRLCLSGARGRFMPDLLAYSDVDPVRMTKRYHRRWQHEHGRHLALMGFGPTTGTPLFGVPLWYWRESAGYVGMWARCRIKGATGAGGAFDHELHAIRALGYIRQSYAMQPKGSALKDLVRVGRELGRRASASLRGRSSRGADRT